MREISTLTQFDTSFLPKNGNRTFWMVINLNVYAQRRFRRRQNNISKPPHYADNPRTLSGDKCQKSKHFILVYMLMKRKSPLQIRLLSGAVSKKTSASSPFSLATMESSEASRGSFVDHNGRVADQKLCTG